MAETGRCERCCYKFEETNMDCTKFTEDDRYEDYFSGSDPIVQGEGIHYPCTGRLFCKPGITLTAIDNDALEYSIFTGSGTIHLNTDGVAATVS